jgi:hypothetical protein
VLHAGIEEREGKVVCRELVLGGQERVREEVLYRMIRGNKNGEIGGAS